MCAKCRVGQVCSGCSLCSECSECSELAYFPRQGHFPEKPPTAQLLLALLLRASWSTFYISANLPLYGECCPGMGGIGPLSQAH